MAAAQNNQLMTLAVIGGGGFLAYKYLLKKEPQAIDPSITDALPPNTQVIPNVGSVLAPPVAPLPSYTGAVPTPYGPVIPSNFNTATTTVTSAQAARMQEMLYRHQYIYNSIAYGLRILAANPNDAGLASRIATLRGKDDVLQAEWAGYTNGQRIPEGTLNAPDKKAAYVAFLRKQGWCDPLADVPC